MRNLLRTITVLAATVGLSFVTAYAQGPRVAPSVGSLQAGVEYNYIRANAPPGGCPCFSANGGDAWLGYNLNSSLGIVGEVASQHASNISSTGKDLTLTSYLVGPRYSYRHNRPLVPFAEVLLGGAHAGGSLSPANSGLNASSNAFAMATGGGLDIDVTKHISIRAIRADYYLTQFTNDVNDHQNNLRISAGMVYSFR